jgi:uridylate kinase
VKVVVRIGGSVVASPPTAEIIAEYAELLERLEKQKHKLVVVVGGGSVARDFIELAQDLGLNEAGQDEVAISVSRLFAQLFALKLGDLSSDFVPRTVDEAVKLFGRGKIVIMGGVKPGMTTDTVSAMIAEKIAADLLVKASDVDGVYTKDPKKYDDAEKIDHLSFDDLGALFELDEHRAGINQILDPTAVRVLQKCRIRMIVVNGFKPENVSLALKGEKVGTIIE